MKITLTKILTFLIIGLFSGVVVAPIIATEVIEEFENESIIITLKSEPYTLIQNNDGQTEISIENFGSTLVPGCPKLPSKTFTVGVPPNAEIVSIELIDEHSERIPGNFEILPTPPESSDGNKVDYNINEEIYASSDPYPTSVYQYLGMSQFRKYNCARIRFNPISYIPAIGSITYYSDITLKINYRVTSKITEQLLSDTVMDTIAENTIINYQSIHPLYSSSSSSAPLETYDYVIITPASFTDSVKFLKKWRELLGHSVNVITTQWIYSNYNGDNIPEKIRNFLIDKYVDWGIKYVLLVGNRDLIPMIYCYPNSNFHTTCVGSDYYYADLTGDWDSDVA